MFLYLSKLISPFLFPPGFQLVLIALGIVLIRRRPRIATALLVFAFATLYLLSTGVVADRLAGAVESVYPEMKPAAAPKADAIVVLGDFVQAPTRQRPQLELKAESDRLRSGGLLFQAGKAPFVLLTGGTVSVYGDATITQAASGKQLLSTWGVPSEAIVTEEASQNTFENAAMSKPILERRGAHRILLVTSGFHMLRSAAIFRRAGFEVIPFPADLHQGWYAPVFPLGFVPDAGSLHSNFLALHELVGIAVYKLRGWA